MADDVESGGGVERECYADAFDDGEEDAIAQVVGTANQKTHRRHEEEDDDDEDDDYTDLAEMFAKVQTIQQAEGIQVKPVTIKQSVVPAQPYAELEVTIPDRVTATKRSSTTPRSSLSSVTSSRTVSPGGSRVGTTRSADGITTISRKALASGHAGANLEVLSGVKKPALFQDRLLQTAKQQPQSLEQLKQKVVAAAPAVIAKRIATLSEPKKNDTGRGGGSRNDFEDDDASGHDRMGDFLARMEATERNRQKKLELTRGETAYLANLNKKVCPKCDVPQSYSEYRDKKKRCQTCGSEFRVPQAWGDIGTNFITRIAEDSRTRDERKEQIRSQVIQREIASGRIPKSATQHYYEKSIEQRNDYKSFLDRNYTTTTKTGVTSTGTSTSTSTAKTKQAQLQLQMQLQAQRAKLLAAAQPPIY